MLIQGMELIYRNKMVDGCRKVGFWELILFLREEDKL
jgi:hypothetical protein